ncbi:MAG: hypothetical protein SGPRY_008723 [Prymnesium sp.]
MEAPLTDAQRLRGLALSVYLPCVVDAFSQSIIIPVLPVYARRIGADAAAVGVIVGARGLGAIVTGASNEVVNPITVSSSEMEMTSLNPPNLVGSEDKQTSADLGSIDVNLWYPLLRAAPVGFTITMGRSSRAMLIPLKVRLPYSREHRFFLETDDDLVHSDTVLPDHKRLPRLGLQRRFERLDDWVRDCCHFHQRHSRVPLGRDHHGQVRPQVGRRPVASSHERRAAPARLRGRLGPARSRERSAGGGQWAVGKRETTRASPATGSLSCAFVLAQCGLVQTIGQDAAPAQERTRALSLWWYVRVAHPATPCG